MILSLTICSFLLLTPLPLAAGPQQADEPQFSVASIKVTSDPNAYRNAGGPGTASPGRWTCTSVTMEWLVRKGWNLNRFQVSGDPALNKTFYDINAIVPDNTSVADFRLMIQNLLKARFNLTAHIEKKIMSIYVLSVSSSGPRLREAEAARTDSSAPSSRGVGMKGSGINDLPPGKRAGTTFGLGGMNKASARMQTIADLAHYLESRLGAYVKDETGLTGTYDYVLEFSKDGPGGRLSPAPGNSTEASTPAPDLFSALKRQLGLILREVKEPVDTLVIDGFKATPSDN